MKRTILRYSLWAILLLCGLGLVNWLLIARPLGYRASEVVGYLSMILALSMIFLAIRHYRSHVGHGMVSFGKGFRIGIVITLITSAVFFVYSVVYFTVWGDDFKDWADSHYRATMPPEQYTEFVAQLKTPLYNNAAFQGLVMFLTVFFIGLIITLISATVLKKVR